MATMVIQTAFFFLLISTCVLATQERELKDQPYEIWASDQSNSAAGQSSLGVKGGFLWIWKSQDIEAQLQGGPEAKPVSCVPTKTEGPCDVLEVFPPSLRQKFQDGTLGSRLGKLDGFGRPHGMIRDPQGLYVSVNMFVPDGGYVGIIDTTTYEAISLFRVTKFSFAGGDPAGHRSVHMSFWSADGSALLVANLNGKAIERIDVVRDRKGKITKVQLDKRATLGLGKGMTVKEEASFFVGQNALGNRLIGTVVGRYLRAGLKDTTPNGKCKENGCGGAQDGGRGGRPNNLPICPIPSSNDNLYITLAGGGLLIADIKSTPMAIVGEYGNGIIYGAGCGGVQTDDTVFMNSGVSASSAGAEQSFFAIWAFDDRRYETARPENRPLPKLVYDDPLNGQIIRDGQIPGTTRRRDSHGMVAVDGTHIHAVDRIQNKVESIRVDDFSKRWTYSLSRDPQNNACALKSVPDYQGSNDPAPDLLDVTPDGKYLVIAFRGPAPVSVPHSAQGSCPGVGIVELTRTRNRGTLIEVLRTTNTIPDTATPSAPGGIEYTGTERSDVHGAIVVPK